MKRLILTVVLTSLTFIISGCGSKGLVTTPPLPFKIPEYKEDNCDFPKLPLYAVPSKKRAKESLGKEDLIRLQDQRIKKLENINWKYYTVIKTTNAQYHKEVK